MKIKIELNDNIESKTEIKAHLEGPLLALCIYNIENILIKYKEKCDEGSLTEDLIVEALECIHDDIGSVHDYTE